MHKILYGANMNIEQIVSDFCSGNRIHENEFRSICKKLIPKLADFEVKSIFNELSRGSRASLDKSLDKDEFISKFSILENERSFQTSIEDILKPL